MNKSSLANSSSGGIFRHGGGDPLLLLAVLLLLSCGTASKSTVRPGLPALEIQGGETADLPPESPGDGESPDDPPLVVTPEDSGESSGEEEFPDEPSVVLTPENPAEDPGAEELEEPLFDFPEAAAEPLAPPERPLAALPDPLAPVFPEPAGPPEPLEDDTAEAETPPPAEEPAPGLAEEPAPGIAEEPAPAPVPPASPPPVPVSPPPPPFIRPAEEYEAPPVREPAPRPLIPDPPAAPLSGIPEPGIIYSRVVRATVGQLVEIPFRGTGWVYLGELASRPGIVYGSRRLDPEGQSFIFRAEAPGTYGLKFYKQDFVQDYILNDHVQVIVGEPPETAVMGWFDPSINRGLVIAEPRWPSALEEAEALDRNPPLRIVTAPGVPIEGPGTVTQGAAGEAQGAAVTQGETGEVQGAAVTQGETGEAQGAAVTQGAGAVSGTIPARPPAAVQTPEPAEGPGEPRPGAYPERAREEFEAGRVASAISILDQFRERYPSGSDESWWLYGQFYEANSPSRDIRTALDYYRRLVREYPQSPHYNEARRRIAYLERYYINIR